VPIQKQIARGVAKGDMAQVLHYLSTAKTATFEELNVWGLVITYTPIQEEERQKFLWEFAHRIDNWSSCDCIVATNKQIRKNLDTYWDFAVGLVGDEYSFAKRFGIVILMSYYLTDEYVDRVLEQIVRIEDDHYYVRMAVAWLIATALVNHYDKAVKILQNRQLDRWTHRKAISKACDSFRLSDEQKNYLRSLR